MEMSFAVVGGHVVPTLRKPDGVGFFTLGQATDRFGIDTDTLTKMHATVIEDAPATSAAPLRPSQDPQWAIYRKVKCPNASDEAFDYFIGVCEQRGLSPWADQAYLDSEHDEEQQLPVPKVIVGIGGARRIAHDTHQYVGIDATDFEEDDAGKLISASVVVYRQVDGKRSPFIGEVRFAERCPDMDKMDKFWEKMPYDSLARCAEAAALRRAFAQELNGLYIAEEMCLMRGHRGGRRHRQVERQSLVEKGFPADRLALETFLIDKCNATNKKQRAALMERLAAEFKFADAEDGEPFAAAAEAVVNDLAKYGLAA